MTSDMTVCVVVLLYLILLCGHCNTISTEKCDKNTNLDLIRFDCREYHDIPTQPKFIAQQALNHWTSRAESFQKTTLRKSVVRIAKNSSNFKFSNMREFSMPPTNGIDKIIQRFGCSRFPIRGIFLIEYLAKSKLFSLNLLQSQCVNDRQYGEGMRNRFAHFVRTLQAIVDNNSSFLNSEVDFEFFIDVKDATPIDKDLFEVLGRPLLSQSFAPSRGDVYTIPIPDLHMTAAMATTLIPQNTVHALNGFGSSLSHNYRISKSSWIEKLNSIVYRGGEIGSTLNFIQGGQRFIPRTRLIESICVLSNKNDQEKCQTYNIQLASAKPKCSNCAIVNLSSRQMSSGWRYQVNVDGYGQSYDGSIWKLLSNSTVIWVISDAQASQNISVQQTTLSSLTDPMFQSWYSSFIKPNCHFISAPPEKVTDAYWWCQCHPQECETMAMAAVKTVQKVVKPAVVREYLKQLLTYLQNWQRDTILELVNKSIA